MVAILLAIFLLVQVTVSIFFLNTWFDEADYGYKAWLVGKGLAEPFMDFRLKHGPVAFYSQLLLQDIVGPSLIASRVFSVFFLLVSLVLIFLLIKRLSNKWFGLVAAALVICNPFLVTLYSSAVPYSLTMFFSILTIWFIATDSGDDKNIRRAIILSGVMAGMAFLVRYNMFPLMVILWLFVFWKWRSWKYFIYAVSSSIATVVILLVPFLLIDLQYTINQILFMFSADPVILDVPKGSFTAGWQPLGSRISIIGSVLTRYFYMWVVLLAVIFLDIKNFVFKQKFFLSDSPILALSASLAVVFFVSHFLYLPRETFAIYSLYLASFLVIFATLATYKTYEHIRSNLPESFNLSGFSCLVIAVLLLTPISIGSFSHIIGSISDPLNFEDSDVSRVRKGAYFLASLTSTNDIILTVDDPHHVFLAGRYEIPPLINKYFTYKDIDDESMLQRFDLYNDKMFLHWLEETATVVVFQRDGLDERLNRISGSNKEMPKDFKRILEEKFVLAGTIESVYPRRYAQDESVMDVYKKKK